MNVISSIQMYAFIVAGTLIALAISGGLMFFYFVKVKKVSASEESIDYDSFYRKDSLEFCKFDDIIKGQGNMGMIHLKGNTYIAGIEVQGYNFGAASADERERTMFNAIAFFNVLRGPIQMSQTVQSIDISQNIKKTTEDAERIEVELINTQQELGGAIENLKIFATNDELFEAENARAKKLTAKIDSLEWQLSEAKELIHYMKYVSDANFNTKRSNQIFFSFEYNPDDELEELTAEEVLLKAEQELRSYAGVLGEALQDTGCTWKILTVDDLTNLLRRHFHPITCDTFRLDELLNSSYNSLYVTTDSIEELERERRGDIEYEQAMREYAESLRKKEEEARKVFESTVISLEREAEKVV